MSWLGADGSGKGGRRRPVRARTARFRAAAAEELDAMGFAADNEKAGGRRR